MVELIMKFIILLIGIAIGVAGYWVYQSREGGERLEPTGNRVESSVRSTSDSTDDSVGDKVRSMRLSGDEIKRELAETGRVIRQKTEKAGSAVADATADGRITAAIKARLVRDSQLSAWDISVDTTGGVVTLSGAVQNTDQIGRAVLLAMETDGVQQVISTLQVKTQE